MFGRRRSPWFRFEGLVAPWRRIAAQLTDRWGKLSGRARRRLVMARMQPADIVLASPRLRRLSFTALMYHLLLRSRYVHAMLYLGDGLIIHTTSRHGVVIGRLPGKVFDHQRYRIRRLPGLSSAERRQVTLEARTLLDHGLDHVGLITNIPARWLGRSHPLLRTERNRLWCGKLIHTAFARAGFEIAPDRAPGTITSEDLASSQALVDLHGGSLG